MKPTICILCGHSLRLAGSNPNICAECDSPDLALVATPPAPCAKITVHTAMAWARHVGSGKPEVSIGFLAAALADVLQDSTRLAYWRVRVMECRE